MVRTAGARCEFLYNGVILKKETMRSTAVTVPLVLLLLASPLAHGAGERALPKGVQLPKGVAVPNDTTLAIYLPAGALASRFYVRSIGLWAEPGKALDDARREVGGRLFMNVLPVTGEMNGVFGLLLSMHPRWSVDRGTLRLDVHYRVFGADAAPLLDGTVSQSVGLNSAGPLGGFPNAAIRATGSVLIELLQNLEPGATKFPPRGELSAFRRELLVDREAPVSTGTAFYINGSGEMLTAAHVLRDCLVIEATRDAKPVPVTLRASSDLLDLAVVDTGQPTGEALPLRVGEQLVPGEAVTHVGFPLQGLQPASPDLTRGNVSAQGGPEGSLGLFRFSAPIQPGSSGGPVVSDGGELLGVTVGTLDAAAVNLALEARYVAMFLRRSGVAFTEVGPRPGGDVPAAHAVTLGAVLPLSCYQ